MTTMEFVGSMTKRPNQPAAGNAGFAPRVQIGHLWPGVPIRSVGPKTCITMSSSEYEMTDLLTLILSKRAEGLSLHVGKPPVVHLHAEPHAIEGPVITPENAESLLRSAEGPTRRWTE